MKWFSSLLPVVAVLFLLSAPGCGLDDLNDGPYDGPLYEWMADGNRMVFDFHPVSDTLVGGDGFRYDDTEGVYDLGISEIDDAHFRLYGEVKWDRIISELNPDALSLEYLRTAEGLKTQECKECGCPGLLHNPKITFVRAPAEPEDGATYPQYFCEDDLEETLRVTAVSKTIEVRAGRFENVFVLHSPNERRKEYWSEAEGIIKIELYEADGDLLGYYELASKNF